MTNEITIAKDDIETIAGIKKPTYAEALDALNFAIIDLMRVNRYPAYGRLIMRICVRFIWSPPEPDGSPTMTLGVDKKARLFCNPWFFVPLDRECKIGVLMHELDHLLLRHPQEMESYNNKTRCNVAMDLCVNSYIKELPRFKYSKEDLERIQSGERASEEALQEQRNPNRCYALYPEQFGFKLGLSAQEYYDQLPIKEDDLQNMLDNMGVVLRPHDWKASSNASQRMEQVIDKAVQKEATKQDRGTLPGTFGLRLKDIMERSKTPWNLLLRRYARMYLLGERGFEFKRPDRRTKMIPGRHRQKKHRCYIVVDTSGSTMQFREAFAKEIMCIWKQTKADMRLIESDAAVQKEPYKFKGTLPDTFSGNGGTAFLPAFEYIHENNLRCSLLIYLTDGYGENPVQPSFVNYPVIWVTTQIDPAAWGRIIKIDPTNDNNQDF